MLKLAFPALELVLTVGSLRTYKTRWMMFWAVSILLSFLESYVFRSTISILIFAIVRVIVSLALNVPPFQESGDDGFVRGRSSYKTVLRTLPQPEDNDDGDPSD